MKSCIICDTHEESVRSRLASLASLFVVVVITAVHDVITRAATNIDFNLFLFLRNDID